LFVASPYATIRFFPFSLNRF